jgi:putative FmdB family regulatory protein
MPIYEFFCDNCNTVFNFYSARINTDKQPDCPGCGKEKLTRQMSTFATVGKAEEKSDDMLAGLDEAKMERAFESLMGEAEQVNEDDPKEMASLMRKFTSRSGIQLGEAMEEAVSRMEAGEDPDQVEKEMGDLLGEEDFSLDTVKKRLLREKRPVHHDQTLYEL